MQMLQMKENTQDRANEANCWLLDQYLQKKLLLSRAKTDSLKVTDEQIEGELDRRIQYFVSQIGSEEALEEYYKKSIVEMKNDFREQVREQLLIEQQQNKIIGNVEVTPQDIREFYDKIPADSLPYYSTEMEIGQIVIYPKVSKVERQKTIDRLRGIRKEILAGANFSTKAIMYSEDKGSAINGGDLGMQRADMYVPEFAAAALSLKKDSISDVIETKYGFHILQLIARKGDMVHVRHILIKPQITEDAYVSSKKLLDSIRTEIVHDSITFETAAYNFSKDEETKNRGGIITDPKTNASRIPVEELDQTIFFAVDKLNVGEISQPLPFKTADGSDAFRLLYLKSKTLPHKANLKDDYPKIKVIVTEYKKALKLESWVNKNIPNVYVHLDDSFKNCQALKHWQNGQHFMVGQNK
jgi:peptidyl-prolyl cis-trans isomerase SurA